MHTHTHIPFMVTTNQKSVTGIHTQGIESNTNIKRVIKSQEENNRRNEQKKNYKNNPQTINKVEICEHVSIAKLNVNGLSGPIKR